MIDLDGEYLEALANTTASSRRELLRVGVTQRALDLAGTAYAKVEPAGQALFQPNPASDRSAFILPVRVEYPDTPESTTTPEAVLERGEIVDLVAFTPQLATRWALRAGNAEWLGACPPQYLEPEPVTVHRSPLDWLRADCQGLVCLATKPLDVLRFLTRFAAVSVVDDAHAEELKAIIDRPLLYPEILVGGRLYGR